MEEPKAMAEALGERISHSPCYREYLQYKDNVEKNPVLGQKIRELKQRQQELEMRRMEGKAVSLEEEKQLSHLYSEVVLNRDGAGFWKSERAVIGLLAEIFETIAKKVPLDLE